MAAYASHQRENSARSHLAALDSRRLTITPVDDRSTAPGRRLVEPSAESANGGALMDALVDQIAERVAAAVAEWLAMQGGRDDEWFDSRHAADYLGVHRDTLRKLAAERAIPSEQDGPGCKLYFRRSDLDAWRRSGGKPRHLASALAPAA